MVYVVLGVIVVAFVVIAAFRVVGTISKMRAMLRRIDDAAADLPEINRAGSVAGSTGAPQAGVLATLPERFDRTAAGDLDAAMQFRVADASPSDWYLEISRGACRLAPGEAVSPRTTVLAPSGVIADIIEGRLSADAAFMAGKVQVEGDSALLFRLAQYFPPGQSNAGTGASVDQTPPTAPGPTTATNGSERIRTDSRSKMAGVTMSAVGALAEEMLGTTLEEYGHLAKPDRDRVVMAAITGRFGHGSILVPGATEASALIRHDHQHQNPFVDREKLRDAVRGAMEALPPDATLQDKARALRAAIQRLNGQPVDVEI